MRGALGEDQVAEILVHRDDDAAFVFCQSEESVVAGIATKFAAFLYIMTRGTQPIRDAPPSAAIDEKLQARLTCTASRLS